MVASFEKSPLTKVSAESAHSNEPFLQIVAEKKSFDQRLEEKLRKKRVGGMKERTD